MPKTATPRMKGWKGKSYDKSGWVESPKVNQRMEEIRRDEPTVIIKDNMPRVGGKK